jgi:hypothetical protein
MADLVPLELPNFEKRLHTPAEERTTIFKSPYQLNCHNEH